MRPYEFSFLGGEGREDCECNYIVDLDKIAAIGKPYPGADGVAYVNIHFAKAGSPLTLRALTGWRVLPGYEKNSYGHHDQAFIDAEF